jgi:nitrate/nitrite transporter NarK
VPSLQGFLFSWLLVGVLERPADEAGFARSLAEFPPLFILLLGGFLGDRFDGRRYLSAMHLLMTLPPLLIAAVFFQELLNFSIGIRIDWWKLKSDKSLSPPVIHVLSIIQSLL